MDRHVKNYPDMQYTFSFEALSKDQLVLRACKEGKESKPVVLKFMLDADDCESLAEKFARAAKALRGE